MTVTPVVAPRLGDRRALGPAVACARRARQAGARGTASPSMGRIPWVEPTARPTEARAARFLPLLPAGLRLSGMWRRQAYSSGHARIDQRWGTVRGRASPDKRTAVLRWSKRWSDSIFLSALAERQIVLARAALVAMALDRQGHVRVLAHERRPALDRPSRIGRQIRFVEVEEHAVAVLLLQGLLAARAHRAADAALPRACRAESARCSSASEPSWPRPP